MNFLRFTKKVKDERITQMQNKIYREMYVLVVIICTLSIIVKSFVYEVDIENVAIELIILFVQGVYYVFRSSNMGLFSAETELHDQQHKTPLSKKNVIGGVVLGFVIALIFGLNSAISYADTFGTAVTYFVMVFLVSLVIYIPFFLLFFGGGFAFFNNRSEKANEKELNEDEFGDDDEKY